MGLLGVLTGLALLPACHISEHDSAKPGPDDDSTLPVDSGDSVPAAPDEDGDGYAANEDCDDTDPTVHPGVPDECNGVDDDCDLETDEDAPTWHQDADGDGYGDTSGILACDEPVGAVADATDCDDLDSEIHPAALDWCDDGVDQDCTGADAVCAPYATTDGMAVQILGYDDDYYMGNWGQVDIGDVDGDGLGDVLIGASARTEQGGEGRAYVLTSPVADGVSAGDADAVLLCGYALDDLCGFGVGQVGDVDGDGVGDVMVGNPASHIGNSALLFLGPVVGMLSAEDATSVWGASGVVGVDSLGEDISGADLDGDGLSDVILGDAYHHSGLAAALVYLAPFADRLQEDDADGRLFAEGHWPPADSGYLSVQGDIDGDGRTDLVFGRDIDDTNEVDSGAVYVFLDLLSGDQQPTDAGSVIFGTEENQGIGLAVDILGDQDGDGRDEVVVSTSAEDAAGADIVLGGRSGTLMLPDDADGALLSRDNDAFLGGRLKSPGDLDGDGFGDLALTAWSEDSNGTDSGSVFVYFGRLLGLRDGDAADLEIRGQPGDDLGTKIGSGDSDGDGITDIVVGAMGHPDAGAVYVITGADILAAVGR